MEILKYKKDDKEYDVYITPKWTRYIRGKYINNSFFVSVPIIHKKADIFSFIDKYFDKLVTQNPWEIAYGDDYIYYLGEKYYFNNNSVVIDCEKISFIDISDLKNQLAKKFLPLIEERNSYYEKVMNISPNKVRLKNVTSRYGSNSKKSKSITYSYILMHYSLPIIDSVVVHELAHCYEMNHSKKFYDVVYKYYPYYKENQKKLKKGIFK